MVLRPIAKRFDNFSSSPAFFTNTNYFYTPNCGHLNKYVTLLTHFSVFGSSATFNRCFWIINRCFVYVKTENYHTVPHFVYLFWNTAVFYSLNYQFQQTLQKLCNKKCEYFVWCYLHNSDVYLLLQLWKYRVGTAYNNELYMTKVWQIYAVIIGNLLLCLYAGRYFYTLMKT